MPGPSIGYNAAMKFQFSMSTLLLATTFAAITFGGILAYRQINAYGYVLTWAQVAWHVGISSILWIPFVFLAYAVGRRTLTLRIVVAFAFAEIFAASLMWVLFTFVAP